MDWQQEIKILITEHFKNLGINYMPKAKIQICLIDFMNLEMKLIKPLPRVVFKSKELLAHPLSIDQADALAYIEEKIKKGKDLTFHQSKGVLKPEYNDQLLNHWFIHHLHLSNTKDGKFYKRTRDVLFAAFNREQAFLIDIRPHGRDGEPNVFSKQEFLEIIDRNWPGVLKVHSHPDAEFLNNKYTDAELAMLRKRGLSVTTTAVNGKIITNPGVGITTSGHNLLVVGRANDIMRYVQEALMEIDKDEEGMRKALSEEAGFEIPELDVQIHRLDKWPFFAVFENNSKCYIEKNHGQAV